MKKKVVSLLTAMALTAMTLLQDAVLPQQQTALTVQQQRLLMRQQTRKQMLTAPLQLPT